jgi:hypothetical protein
VQGLRVMSTCIPFSWSLSCEIPNHPVLTLAPVCRTQDGGMYGTVTGIERVGNQRGVAMKAARR